MPDHSAGAESRYQYTVEKSGDPSFNPNDDENIVIDISYDEANETETYVISGIDDGEYKITVTDIASCAVTFEEEIENPGPLDIIVSSKDIVCYNEANGSITVQVKGGVAPYVITVKDDKTIVKTITYDPDIAVDDEDGDFKIVVATTEGDYHSITFKGLQGNNDDDRIKTYAVVVEEERENGCDWNGTADIVMPEEFSLLLSLAPRTQPILEELFVCSPTATGSIRRLQDGGTGDFRIIEFYKDEILIPVAGFSFGTAPIGKYYAVAEDENGCPSITNTIEIILLDDLQNDDFNIIPNPETCTESGSIEIIRISGGMGDGADEYEYQLFEKDGDGTPVQSGLLTTENNTIADVPAGDYYIEIKYSVATNCSPLRIPESDYIVIDPAMLFDFTFDFDDPAPICEGQYGTGALTITDGFGKYAVTLSEYPAGAKMPTFDANTGLMTNVTAGKYSFIVTDKVTGCQVTRDIQITLQQGIEIEAELLDITCEVSTISVEVTYPVSGVFEFEIDGVIVTPTPTYTKPRNVYGDDQWVIKVTDQNGCQADTTIVVEFPSSLNVDWDIREEQDNCNPATIIDAAITGGFTSYSIEINGSPVTLPHTITQPGAYTIKITDGCDIVQRDITVSEGFQLKGNPNIVIQPTNCNQSPLNGVIILPDLPDGYSYLWAEHPLIKDSDKEKKAQYYLAPDVYHVTVYYGNNVCAEEDFTVTALTNINVDITVDGSICPGSIIPLNGSIKINGVAITATTSGISANWILPDGDTPDFFMEDNPYLYPATEGIVQLIASNGECTGSGTFEIETLSAPTLAFAADTIYIPQDEIYTLKIPEAGNYVSYEWTIDGSKWQNQPDPMGDIDLDSYNAPYILTLTLTSENGCAISKSIYVGLAIDLFIPNAFTPNGDGDHDEWKFRNLEKYMSFYDVQVSVNTRTGVQIYEAKGYNNSSVVWDGRRNGNDLPIGVYYYIVKLVPKSSSKSKTMTLTGSVTVIR
jgi:gliding motility-associated-like protein